uniref:Methylated-DNA--protein-cysteine methyltransferase n=2 Tax=Eptatretus burgeri TaxID=7764 RepID=A0A8C4NGS4_EPTBU
MTPRRSSMTAQKSSLGTCILDSTDVHTICGTITVTACGRGIHQLDLPLGEEDSCRSPYFQPFGKVFPKGKAENVLMNEDCLSQVHVVADKATKHPHSKNYLDWCRKWLQVYSSNPKQASACPQPPLHHPIFLTDSFTRRILLALLTEVPPSHTVSYGHLAAMLAAPRAARAVGMALRRNPVPLLVPCHRVIRSDNSIGGFAGRRGIHLKRRLLQHESLSHTSF